MKKNSYKNEACFLVNPFDSLFKFAISNTQKIDLFKYWKSYDIII